MINPHKYQMDQANINTRLNNVERQVFDSKRQIEDTHREIVSARDMTMSVHSTMDNINYDLNFYKNIIVDLTNRIEALEKHTLIHMAMPTKDELNTFLDGGDAH